MPTNVVWPWIEGEDDMEGAARNGLEAYDDLIEKLDALSSTVQSIHHALEYEQVSPHILNSFITINNAIIGISKESFSIRMKLAGGIAEVLKRHE